MGAKNDVVLLTGGRKTDPELRAITRVVRILDEFDAATQARILGYVSARVEERPWQQPLPFDAAKPE